MIDNIQTYTRNLAVMIMSIICWYLFLEFIFFRGLMSYLYSYPWWKQLYYSFGDMYAVLKDIHYQANNINGSKEVLKYANIVLNTSALLFCFGCFIIFIIINSVFKKLLPTNLKQEETRFANYSELKRAGLLQDGGAIIAGYQKWYGKVVPVTSVGEDHIYMESTTGTGKSVAGSIPSALSWKWSMIVNDNKGEICKKSAGWRYKELHQQIIQLFLSVLAPGGAFFNPLQEMRKCSYNEQGDVQKLGLILGNLTDTEYLDSSNPNIYFVRAPIHFINSCVIHCLYTKTNPTMKDVAEMVAQRDINALKDEILNTNHIASIKELGILTEAQLNFLTEEFAGESIHPFVKKNFEAIDIVMKSEKQFAGLIDSVRTMLNVFYDPLIQKITSKSSFMIQDIVDNYNPTTLYIIYEPSDQARVSVIIRMIVEMASQYMVRDGNKPVFRHNLLLLLDEMKQLGKLGEVQRNMEIGRSAGIKVYAIVQEKAQLEDVYGKNQIITSQAQIKVTYRPNTNSVEYVQKFLVGNTEKEKTTFSESSDSGARNSTSKSRQNEEKPLLSIQQLLNLPIIKKKTITINYLKKLQSLPKRKYQITNEEWVDISDALRKITAKFPNDTTAAELYQFLIRNINLSYLSEEYYNKLMTNQNFIDYISRPIGKEIAVAPGDVIINASNLSPFRQYRGKQFCYMFDKEFLRRSKMQLPPPEEIVEPIDFVYGKKS
ncbi:MAG: hypothetical protein EKK54_06210 [Neisseriaceae bacterium]|nr:MAG: hypothetical protein EKK54_06210 [Neisseriaceae bacterium]